MIFGSIETQQAYPAREEKVNYPLKKLPGFRKMIDIRVCEGKKRPYDHNGDID